MSKDIRQGNVRLVTFYLPQFHPIPENDAWWGKGFTEWTNVTRATPLFPGHYQPQLPTDLGFYDLRLRETRREQIRMAREYGIDAFCYHYYWFSGKRLLEAPLDDMLADPESDMPFCLCWANENWSRRWNGGDQDVLIEQQYRPEDALRFIQEISPYITDSRYLKVDGKPILIVYRPQLIPDIEKVVAVWREHCRNNGIGEIHLCAALTFNNLNYEQFGFDSGVEFPPHNRDKLGVRYVTNQLRYFRPFIGSVMMAHDLANAYLKRDTTGKNIFRGVFPGWDNTARRKDAALLFLNSTPGNYEFWLDQAIKKTHEEHPGSDRLVFINAWNEWAEGCHLEPDEKFDRLFLQATLRAKHGNTTFKDFPDTGIPYEATASFLSVIHEIKQDWLKYKNYISTTTHRFIKEHLDRFPILKNILRLIFFWMTEKYRKKQHHKNDVANPRGK
jgi:lipopolysaccharide biosynthesis protein